MAACEPGRAKAVRAEVGPGLGLVADDKVPLLVRSVLFEVEPREACNPQFVDIVTERLLTAVHGHLEEDRAAFEKWFLGSKNSLVHQLSKQTKSPGGPLEESAVRKVLLQLGWQSYSYAGNCIHAQMRLFQNAIPDPLNERERLLFEHMHQRQPYLGNLPRVLLLPRFGFLQGVLWELWDRLPDLSLVPVLHRLLDYYSVLACRRREADRRIKNGRPIRFVEAAYEPRSKTSAFRRSQRPFGNAVPSTASVRVGNGARN
jgi:hypothetical protein